VARHDNRLMLQFAGDFLAGAERDNGLSDFPDFLGREVALRIDETQPVGALALTKAAELQRMLEASGRLLRLAAADALSSTRAGPDLIYIAGYGSLTAEPDLLADLDLRLVEEVVTPTVRAATATVMGGSTPERVQGGGVLPAEGEQPGRKGTPLAPVAPPEAPPLGTPSGPAATPLPPLPPHPELTPALTPELTPALTPATDSGAGGEETVRGQAGAPTGTATGTVTGTVTVTVTEAADRLPATATAQMRGSWEESSTAAEAAAAPIPTPIPTSTPTPTPQVRLVLERTDGLRLLADETVLYVRSDQGEGSQLLAVLGNSEQAISAAVTRLINRDFGGCLVENDLIICPYSPGAGGAGGASGAAGNAGAAEAGAGADERSEQAVTPGAGATPGAEEPPGPEQKAAAILIVDDNAGAGADEASEAAIYLTTLVTAGYAPELWVVSEQGAPAGSDLSRYGWVVWSDAGYGTSAIDGENLRVIGEYINQGGRLTISSRMPFFGVGPKSPSVIRDVQVTDEVPALAAGLPTTPILLLSDTPVLSPLEENPDPGAGAVSALARGPASADAGAPVLILMSDAGFDDPKGARLLLCGISMGWLPGEISEQLIRNMADVMLAEQAGASAP